MNYENVYEEKKLLRSKMRKLLKERYSDLKNIQAAGNSAAQKIILSEEFKNSDLIFSYIPYGFEIDPSFLVEIAWKNGKTVCVPRVVPDSNLMDFYFLDSKLSLQNQLESGAFGILEPKLTLKKVFTDSSLRDKKIFMVVPGLAFSKDGARLGKGKGFYDLYLPRLLKTGCSLFTAGFAYCEQIVENIPVEKTDFFLDRIFTP
ncbi:5-formyltetrahydrofolate cyclo-ligase [Treponema sp. UBA7567]|uniref:5-formyltetrahydrofolate cyclo-ligase n=1 Tax=Treponema sp. UBA7567 TaxID=1947748 RepID=UPI0025EAC156|nr:5-formyltetrahydrofolate cyclo-ligase [Treponema sp. UBA7567]